MLARIFMLEHYEIFIYIICTFISHIAYRIVYRQMYDLPLNICLLVEILIDRQISSID